MDKSLNSKTIPESLVASVSDSAFRYCWLNINTGKFSNSWEEKDMKYIDDNIISIAKKDGWKLIKYECLTDEKFEFYDRMQLRYMHYH